jgi:hypothetical protein
MHCTTSTLSSSRVAACCWGFEGCASNSSILSPVTLSLHRKGVREELLIGAADDVHVRGISEIRGEANLEATYRQTPVVPTAGLRRSVNNQ